MLHCAVLGGAEIVVQLLLEARAEPASQDDAGRTALSLAVLVGQWRCAETLLLSIGGGKTVQVAKILPYTQTHVPYCS